MKRTAVAAMALAGVLWGCDHNEYDIVITPKAQQLLRKITVARLDITTDESGKATKQYRAFPQNELEALAKVYGVPAPAQGQNTYTFEGTFKGQTPADVGGAGSYTTIETPLGSTQYYSERFRGDDDQAALIQKSLDSLDQFLDILIGWLKSDLGKENDFDKLERFLDRDARKDLKNMGMAMWVATAMPRLVNPDDQKAREAIQAVAGARAVQYLAERKYLSVSDVPAVYRLFGGEAFAKRSPGPQTAPAEKNAQAEAAAKAQSKADFTRFLTGLLARKAGVTNEKLVARIVGLIEDYDAAGESLAAYYAKTDHYKAAVKRWHQRQKENPKGAPDKDPEPSRLLGELAMECVPAGLFSFGTDDKVRVTLKTPVEPVVTNGTWDPKAQEVTWGGDVKARTDLEPPDPEKKDQLLPMFCYAAWARPDAKFQNEHFGKVLLAGKGLAEYCTWYKSLSPAEAAKWDAIVAKLSPGAELAGQLKSGRSQPEQKSTDYLMKGAEILLEALEGKDKEK